MRITYVRAHAFGPFQEETLRFAPGMTVIHGPNESGKSSWHAALFAALCGMRRTRGRAPKENQDFADRHRPWRGRSWSVAAQIVLDEGRTIDLEQNLAQAGASTAVDAQTNQPVSELLPREGPADVAVLLGLDRKIVLSTLFVRQADILRVLGESGELQEYLERAAATTAVDTTADEALQRAETYHKERIGLIRRGSRRPLQLAMETLDEARASTDALRDKRLEYNELLARKYRAELDLKEVETKRLEVEAHELERERREGWAAVQEAEKQLSQAQEIYAVLAAGPKEQGPSDETISIVTRALAAFDTRPSPSEELTGLDADALERELAAIPERPTGDLEPAAAVTDAFESWRNASARMAAHEEGKPSLPKTEGPNVPPQELRRLADDLDQPLPLVDESLRIEIERERSAGFPVVGVTPDGVAEAKSSSRRNGFMFAGAASAIVGITTAVLIQPILGIILTLVGLGLLSMALQQITRTSTEVAREASDTTRPPGVHADLTRLEARLAVQEESLAQVQARRERAISRLRDANLPDDPSELRALAATAEDMAAAARRLTTWMERVEDLQRELKHVTESLVLALADRGVECDDHDVEAVFRVYLNQCRARARVAHEADRGKDLASQIETRRAAETAQAGEKLARERADRELLAAAALVGISGSSSENVAEELRTWLASEETLREERRAVAEARARLDQILGGRTISDLESEVKEMQQAFGGDPPDESDELTDRSAELEDFRRRERVLRDQVSELIGQAANDERGLGDLSEALEAEARAERDFETLKELDQDCRHVIQFLNQAKEKVHADIAPVINQTLRPWVPLITDGKYDDISVEPSSLAIQVRERTGDFRSAQLLSHGTTEQLFLLLRLALAQHLTTTGESAPLILDDVTVQSDEERTIAVLNLLHQISNDHQVILFTQENEVLVWARQHLSPERDRLMELERR